ncbi:MAG: hypothetical protein LBH29_06750 [Elusimicrobiota bacterium]|jgi:predicted transcriptional regulator of viral defense system|nr:hypothetical protein [Elusimicrobiota bacterium]
MQNLSFNTLNKQEISVISMLSWERRFNNKNVFTFSDIKRYLPNDYGYSTQFVSQLIKKNILSPIKKGIYVFNPIENISTGVKLDSFVIADKYMSGKNYYIGYSSLFNWYGFSGQIFQDVYVINQSISLKKIMFNTQFNFVKVKQGFMYGIIEQEISDGKVKITDKERSMIDLLYWNGAVGGIKPAMKIFEKTIRENKCDIEKLVNYAAIYPRPIIRKIIGVILDEIGIKTDSIYKTIADTSLTSAKWDTRSGSKNNKWKIILQ